MHASVLLPREGEPVIQVASIEVAVAMLKSCIEDIASYGWSSPTEIRDQLASLIRERGLADRRIGIEMQATGLRIEHYNGLRAALPEVDFADSTDLLLDLRIVKSAAEVECLRKAAGYTWAGIEAGLAEIAPGKTDNDVAAAGFDAMVRAGSEFMSIQPVVTSGRRHGWIHSNFARLPLAKGDTVFLEFGGVHNRYSAPMMRTAYLGSPPDDVLRVNAAVNETTQRIIEATRPGRTCHDVAVDAGKGFDPVRDVAFHSEVYGYTVGIEFPPTWVERSAFIVEGDETVLEAGMAFHLPTCFRVPSRFGVGTSETIVVTEGGCEVLTRPDRDLHVVPV